MEKGRIVDYIVISQSTYGVPNHTIQVYGNKLEPTFAQLVKDAIGKGWVPFGNMMAVNYGRENYVAYSQPMVKYGSPEPTEPENMRYLVLGNGSKSKTRRRRQRRT